MWSEVGERSFYGPDLVREAEEKVEQVREHIRVAQSRQKSYADKRRRPLEFFVDDYVYLKVSPLRGTRRFHVRGKLAPRFIGPFRVVRRIGDLAYQLELPGHLAGVHDVFHVSQLKKCLRVPEEQVAPEVLDLQDSLEYLEYPVKILDVAFKETRSRKIKFCKVLWSNHTEREATWEMEDNLRKDFPHLFEDEE